MVRTVARALVLFHVLKWSLQWGSHPRMKPYPGFNDSIFWWNVRTLHMFQAPSHAFHETTLNSEIQHHPRFPLIMCFLTSGGSRARRQEVWVLARPCCQRAVGLGCLLHFSRPRLPCPRKEDVGLDDDTTINRHGVCGALLHAWHPHGAVQALWDGSVIPFSYGWGPGSLGDVMTCSGHSAGVREGLGLAGIVSSWIQSCCHLPTFRTSFNSCESADCTAHPCAVFSPLPPASSSLISFPFILGLLYVEPTPAHPIVSSWQMLGVWL